jgi:hypothetical protein
MANPDPRLNEIEFEFLANFVAEQNSDGSRGFSQNNDWNLELVTLESFDHIRIELKCPLDNKKLTLILRVDDFPDRPKEPGYGLPGMTQRIFDMTTALTVFATKQDLADFSHRQKIAVMPEGEYVVCAA